MKNMVRLKARYTPYITPQCTWKEKHPAGAGPGASEL